MNECMTNPCPVLRQCKNTVGSYECGCIDGYQSGAEQIFSWLNSISHQYRQIKIVNPCPKFIEGTDECENVNECDLNDDLCLAKGQFCSDTEGSYECLCDSGYEQRNYDLACIDINECAGGISDSFS